MTTSPVNKEQWHIWIWGFRRLLAKLLQQRQGTKLLQCSHQRTQNLQSAHDPDHILQKFFKLSVLQAESRNGEKTELRLDFYQQCTFHRARRASKQKFTYSPVFQRYTEQEMHLLRQPMLWLSHVQQWPLMQRPMETAHQIHVNYAYSQYNGLTSQWKISHLWMQNFTNFQRCLTVSQMGSRRAYLGSSKGNCGKHWPVSPFLHNNKRMSNEHNCITWHFCW
jgi:hypothetical protein